MTVASVSQANEQKSCHIRRGGHFLAMKRASKFKLVLITAPDLKTARKLARAALGKRLIACANLVPKIESHYWWRGKIESSAEVLLILKTTAAQVAALERLVVEQHPYDTPEFVVLSLSDGNQRYLNWLESNCKFPQ
jgi:periplasmic divalent cation tolerance protein